MNTVTPVLASRRRRIGSLAYEAFLLLAVLFVAGFILVPIVQVFPEGGRRLALQCALLVVAGVYSVSCWVNGHTLPMKTWGIRLARSDGTPVTMGDAIKRFMLAIPSVGLCGIGLFWALADREKQFAHDRLAGTRLFDAHLLAPLEPDDNPDAGGEKKQSR